MLNFLDILNFDTSNYYYFWNKLFPRQNSYLEKLYQKYGLWLALDYTEAIPMKSEGWLE